MVIPEGKNLVEVAEILDAAGVASKAALVAQGDRSGVRRRAGPAGDDARGVPLPRHLPAAAAHAAGARAHPAWCGATARCSPSCKAAHAKTVAELKKTLGFDDPKIVTLASIVEKETGRAEERPRIAQVFINRLRMPTFVPKLLQTDPTIIYGCTVATPRSNACLKWDGRIRRIQLDDHDNPYNTYTHEGLPPGPISNPGRAALEAVMAPDHTRLPLLRGQERRHALLLQDRRRAQRRGGQVPARRQAARRNDRPTAAIVGRGAGEGLPVARRRCARCCAGACSASR